MKKKNSTEPIFIDPVCYRLLTLNRGGVDRFTYRLRTYYFCSPSCRRAFEMNPGKYLNQKPSGKNNLKQYLNKLKQMAGLWN